MTVHLETLDEGRVAHLCIDRPTRRNAIDVDAMNTLAHHFDTLEAMPNLLAVVLSSTGDQAFIAGGDLKAFRDLHDRGPARAMVTQMTTLLERFEHLPAPIIAAIDGDAFGGGCEILLSCDLRVAHHTARFGFTQIRFGLTPGWGGATRLARQVGRHRALHWLVTGAIVNAPEAETAGLIEVCTPQAARPVALELAHKIARQSPLAVRGLKRALHLATRDQDAGARVAEREAFVDLWLSDDHFEAVEAFFAKRDPRWSGQ